MPIEIETENTRMLGIGHPVVLDGMTGVGTPELAAAVSDADCLGIFTIHNAGSPEGGREWIRRMRRLTTKPFGVNLAILPSMGSLPLCEEYVPVIVKERVQIVKTAGNSPKLFVKMFKDASLITIHTCILIRHALIAERYGVGIILLDGFKCRGQPGEEDVGNFVLQARGAQALSRPHLCADVVTDGQQVALALALGADGVNCGKIIVKVVLKIVLGFVVEFVLGIVLETVFEIILEIILVWSATIPTRSHHCS